MLWEFEAQWKEAQKECVHGGNLSVSGISVFQNAGTFMAFSRSKRPVLFFSCCSCCSSVWSRGCAFDATNSCEANLGPLLVGPQERGEVLQTLFVLRYWKAQDFHPVVPPDAKSLSVGRQWECQVLSHSPADPRLPLFPSGTVLGVYDICVLFADNLCLSGWGDSC